MKKVKVSVIIPVYNVEKYIKKCLDSLVNQTLKDIEIIVVNDGSPDKSQKIIDKYVKKYPDMIKSYVKENGGQGSARNFGFDKSKGKYICYVDSDDYIDEDMIEKLYNNIEQEKSDIAICGNKIISEDYQLIKNETAFEYDYHDNVVNALFGKMAVWNKIYKRELIEDNNLQFRSKVWYEDLDFSVKAILSANKISYIDEPLYNYLLRPGSTMNNSNINRNLELIQAFDEVLTYAKKNKKYNKKKDEIEFLCVDHMYISAIVRIILADADKKNKKVVIKKFKDYLNENFKKFKKNKYLKSLKGNRKIIYNLIKNNLYGFVKMIFKIKQGVGK